MFEYEKIELDHKLPIKLIDIYILKNIKPRQQNIGITVLKF